MYSPKFTITNKILKNIGIIEAAKEVIDHAPLLPYFEKQFRDDALIRTVHYGTHIEGNALDLSQAERVIQGQSITARERDIREVINYRKVIQYIGEVSVKNPEFKVDMELIKKLHKLTTYKILPEEKTGVFRDKQVVIKNSSTGEVSFRPPPSLEVPYRMEDLIEFINSQDDVHPVLKAGIIHYEFVRIHPYTDGNGRVARALSTLFLFIKDYDIKRFFSLEEYFDSNPSDYYHALQSVDKKSGDLTDWLSYFSEGLAVELSKVKERVEKVSIDGALKEKLGGKPILLSDRQLRIIEYIQKTGFIQNKIFPQLFPMVSEDTVLNELKGLIKAGIIRKQGSTKGAKYLMS